MAKTYLVTGGTGFIGAALVHRLVKDGHRVRVLDNDFRGSADRLSGVIENIEFFKADICDRDAVIQASQDIDSVIHLAYINGTEFFYAMPEKVLDVGIRGMFNVLDACRKCNIGELVLASTSEVYQTPPIIPTDESVPLSIPDVSNPRYSYGGGKIACELLAMNYGRTGFDRVMIFRPHNVYGPDMGWEHVLPQFILRAVDAIAKTSEGLVPFHIQGDGSQTRAFIHIDDFIEGIMCLLHNGQHLEIYHVGNPEELTIREVAQKVVRYFGREPQFIEGELPQGGTLRRCPDISKLGALGFSPKKSFDQGLPSIADWYQSHSHLRPKK